TSPLSALSLHDALPIYRGGYAGRCNCYIHRTATSTYVWIPDSRADDHCANRIAGGCDSVFVETRFDYAQRHRPVVCASAARFQRSEEHTSELQSRSELV